MHFKRTAPESPGKRASPSLLPWRIQYAAAALLVVGAGLLWRAPVLPLSAFARKYGGDALWALMVYLGFRFLLAHRSVWWSVGLALLFAFSIEFSQLYHPPWLDAIRSQRLGRLILGSTFNWPDLPAYTFGILAGATADYILRRRGNSPG